MKKLNALETLGLKRVTVADLMSVYSGKPGKCCCGCAGSHRYTTATREAAGKRRGLALDDDEVNDRQVAKVLGILQAHPEAVVAGDNNFSAVIGGRLYVAYPIQEAK